MRDSRASAARAATVNAVTSPAGHSEREQARLFAGILRNEVEAMHKNVAKAEIRWKRRCEIDGYVDPPERLIAIRARIDEVERMLVALDTRFSSKRTRRRS